MPRGIPNKKKEQKPVEPPKPMPPATMEEFHSMSRRQLKWTEEQYQKTVNEFIGNITKARDNQYGMDHYIEWQAEKVVAAEEHFRLHRLYVGGVLRCWTPEELLEWHRLFVEDTTEKLLSDVRGASQSTSGFTNMVKATKSEQQASMIRRWGGVKQDRFTIQDMVNRPEEVPGTNAAYAVSRVLGHLTDDELADLVSAGIGTEFGDTYTTQIQALYDNRKVIEQAIKRQEEVDLRAATGVDVTVSDTTEFIPA